MCVCFRDGGGEVKGEFEWVWWYYVYVWWWWVWGGCGIDVKIDEGVGAIGRK